MAVSAKSKSVSNTKSAAVRQEKRKFRRGLVLLILLLVLLCAAVASLFWIKHLMFEKNRNFTLKVVEVANRGYWGKNAETRKRLLNLLKLEPNKDNLFELDVRDIRKRLLGVPNIADAQVQVVLPDTLKLELEERLPRAFLGRSGSNLVADGNGMVMQSSECFGVHPQLPVIVGLRSNAIKPGVQLADLREALSLIMSVQYYRNFRVELVSIGHENELLVLMQYIRNKQQLRYQVTFPHGNYRDLLDILQSAIADALRHNDNRSKVNLTFDGAVVMSK